MLKLKNFPIQLFKWVTFFLGVVFICIFFFSNGGQVFAAAGDPIAVACTVSGPRPSTEYFDAWDVSYTWEFSPHPKPPGYGYGSVGIDGPAGGGGQSTGGSPSGSGIAGMAAPIGSSPTFTVTLYSAITGGQISTTCSGSLPAPTVNISATPNPVSYNSSTTLDWSSQNATSCTATKGAGFSTGGGTSGSDGSDNLTNNDDFTVTCTGPGGTASDSVSVTVNPPPLTCSLSASNINQGGGVDASATGGVGSYSWSTPGANVSGNAANLGLQYTSAGTYSVDVSTPASGQSKHCGDVTVNPSGPFVNLNATPKVNNVPTVSSGNAATLTWDSGYVTSCVATEGAGFYTGSSSPTSGSDISSPLTAQERFTVTCSGPNGPASDSVIVYVTIPPGIPPACTGTAQEATTTSAISGSLWVEARGVTNATSVKFPTWGDVGGQDDIVWYDGVNLGSGTWRAYVDLSRHKIGNPEYGNINVHVYTYNASYTSGVWCGSANFTRTLASAPAVSLTANPVSGTLGQQVSLAWLVTGTATSCTARSSSNDWVGTKSFASNNTETITPTVGAHSYTIYCSNNGLNSPDSTASVTITYPPPTATLSASPNPVIWGDATTLRWSSTNTSSCTALAGSGFYTGGLTSGSDASSSLTSLDIFRIRCNGLDGTYVDKEVTVPVTIPTLSCSVSSTTAQPGQQVIYTANNAVGTNYWTYSAASGVSQSGNTLTITYGFTGTMQVWVSTSAQTTVSCPAVVVNYPPDPTATLNYSGSPSAIAYNTPATLTWTSQNASACYGSGPGFSTGSSNALSGTDVSSNLTVDTDFTLTCTGTYARATPYSVTVRVPVTPGTTALTCTPLASSIQAGTSTAVTAAGSTATTGFTWTRSPATGSISGTTNVATYTAPSSVVSNTTITITVAHTGNTSGTCSVTVTPAYIPPPDGNLSYVGAPNPISYNTPATLTWNSTNTSGCTETSGPGFYTGGLTAGSDASSNLTSQTNFSMRCTGLDGSYVDRTVTVPVGSIVSSPVSCTITTPSPLYINTPITATATGGTAPLSWVVTGGATGTGQSFTTQFSSVGNYQFTVTSAGSPVQTGTCFASVTTPPPSPPSVNLTVVSPVNYNSPTTLTWRSTNVATCIATTSNWSTGGATNNSVGVQSSPLTASTNFTILCWTSAGVIVTDSQNVVVNPPASLSCSPASSSIQAGTNVNINAGGTTATTGFTWTRSPATGSISGTTNVATYTAPSSVVSNTTITITVAHTGNTSGTCSLTVTPIPSPTATLTYNTNPASIPYNTPATLVWTSQNADACYGSGGFGFSTSLPGNPNATNGSDQTTNLTSNTSFTLTCTGIGTPAVVLLTVPVGPAPTPTPQALSCSPASSSIQAGTSTAVTAGGTTATTGFTWTRSPATGSISGTTNIATYTAPSSVVSNTTITITVAHTGNTSGTCSVTVTPVLPPTVTLIASPTNAVYTTPVSLTWTPGNSPDSCTASSNPSGIWTNVPPKSASNGPHSENITPPIGITDYTITCSKGASTVSDTQRVTITSPPVMSCSLLPRTVYVGSPTTATATNGLGTYAWTAFGGSVSGSGSSVAITYASPGTYAVSVATSAGQSASCGNVTVNSPSADLTNSNKDVVSVNGTSVSFHETDGTSEANVQNLSIAEGTGIGFKVHVVNSGSAAKTGNFTITDVLSNLVPPTGGWSLSNVSITCNNLSCFGRYRLSGVSYNSGTKTVVFTITSIGGTLAPGQFISLAYTAVAQGPTAATENVFRFSNLASIDFSDGTPQLNCGSLSVCPLRTPLVLFFRRLSVPFLKEVQ